MKIQWPDDDSPRQNIPLDDLCMDDPWLCVRYAYQHDLVYKPGWEWIPKCLDSSETLTTMMYIHLGHQSLVERNTKLEWKFHSPQNQQNCLMKQMEISFGYNQLIKNYTR